MPQTDTPELKVEVGEVFTHNVLPLLHEIRHALAHLLETGETGLIDLRSIPLAPGEAEQIEETLGTGEVQAVLDAMGPSEVRETVFPGVWLVTHYNYDKQVMGKFIEITRIPSLLTSQDDDMKEGLQQLDERLEDMK